MALDTDELAEAQRIQAAAASDPSPQVRLVAGPGTGKSKTIEERVCWLLGEGVDQDRIAAVSFTRASAQDLSRRVAEASRRAGHEAEIRVSTLHALALRVLRRAGALEAYPVDPLVLDGWELENLFDAEFGQKAGVGSKLRRREIREDFEALWSTGQHRRPTGQTPPDPPISGGERDSFRAFHTPRTHLYACVLPGELVQRCVERIEAGTLDPVTLLEIDHLIVDEFQDLNPMDLRFVDALAQRGVTVFVAGDDDQSLYSFRYAAPSGIRRFPETYPDAGEHSLRQCFRCTPAVLNAAETLIASNAEPERIPNEHVSMYDHADPRVAGGVGCWRFTDDEGEARAIAASIQRLCAAGMPARQIMILLANANALCRALLPALDDAGIPYEVPRTTPFKDTDTGRALMTALRLGVRDDDFVALRTMFTVRRGVGVGTAAAIGDVVIGNNLSYRDLFDDVDENLFSRRQLSAIKAVRDMVEQAREWGPNDELRERADQVDALLPNLLNREPEAVWRDEFAELPEETSLAEALQYLAAEKDEQRARVLAAIHRRLGNDVLVEELLPDAVRVMTMHGAKGSVSADRLHPGTRTGDPAGPEAPALHRAGARGRTDALCLDHTCPARMHSQLRGVAHDARHAGEPDRLGLHQPPRHDLHPPHRWALAGGRPRGSRRGEPPLGRRGGFRLGRVPTESRQRSSSRKAALSPGRGLSAAGRLVVDGKGSAPVLVSRSLAKLVVDWLDLDWRTLAVV